MPTVQADRLELIARDLLMGAGATEHEAASVAEGVVGANLAGHDSHGIIQIPSYIERIEVGHIVCGAPMDVVRETPDDDGRGRQTGASVMPCRISSCRPS